MYGERLGFSVFCGEIAAEAAQGRAEVAWWAYDLWSGRRSDHQRVGQAPVEQAP